MLLATSYSVANFANTIFYVDDDNTEGPWDGSIQHPFQLIQDAIDASKNRDTVIVLDGLYMENLIIDSSIILQGSESTIIDGLRKNTTITVFADNCTIQGFTITNCSPADLEFEHCLMLVRSDNNTIQNNRYLLEGTVGFYSIAALQIQDAQKNKIIKNTFIAEDNISRNHAIHLQGQCTDTILEENNINGYDVAISDSYDNTLTIITKNILSKNMMGMELYGSSIFITNNTIKFNKANGILIFNGFQHIITNNEISENGQNDGVGASPGLMLYKGMDMVIENNNFDHNAGPAIYIYRSYDNHIIENNIIDNGWNYEQDVKPNTFVYTHLSDILKTNKWEQNYWEPSSDTSWQKIPSDLQIFAYFDFVYSIPWYAFDKNPAQEPWM